ncbi:Chromate transporter, long chain, partial [Klenkia terrae]
VVTFGGAYAVLAYVAQQAVAVYGWLSPGEMVRGLALAESTPGPLIIVVQFLAFLGAYRAPGDLDPWEAAVLASLLVTWVTFVPSFLFVLLGAPYMERLRGNRSLSAALTGITAAVVGVIANLGVYFAVHTLFRESSAASWGSFALEVPDVGTLRWVAVVLTVVAAVLLFRLKLPVLKTLGICAGLGLAAGLAGLPVS